MLKIDGILPKSIYRFHSILLKLQQSSFVKMGRMFLKFTWKLKGPKIATQTCQTREKLVDSKFSVSKLTVTVMKIELIPLGSSRICRIRILEKGMGQG